MNNFIAIDPTISFLNRTEIRTSSVFNAGFHSLAIIDLSFMNPDFPIGVHSRETLVLRNFNNISLSSAGVIDFVDNNGNFYPSMRYGNAGSLGLWQPSFPLGLTSLRVAINNSSQVFGFRGYDFQNMIIYYHLDPNLTPGQFLMMNRYMSIPPVTSFNREFTPLKVEQGAVVSATLINNQHDFRWRAYIRSTGIPLPITHYDILNSIFAMIRIVVDGFTSYMNELLTGLYDFSGNGFTMTGYILLALTGLSISVSVLYFIFRAFGGKRA